MKFLLYSEFGDRYFTFSPVCQNIFTESKNLFSIPKKSKMCEKIK